MALSVVLSTTIGDDATLINPNTGFSSVDGGYKMGLDDVGLYVIHDTDIFPPITDKVTKFDKGNLSVLASQDFPHSDGDFNYPTTVIADIASNAVYVTCISESFATGERNSIRKLNRNTLAHIDYVILPPDVPLGNFIGDWNDTAIKGNFIWGLNYDGSNETWFSKLNLSTFVFDASTGVSGLLRRTEWLCTDGTYLYVSGALGGLTNIASNFLKVDASTLSIVAENTALAAQVLGQQQIATVCGEDGFIYLVNRTFLYKIDPSDISLVRTIPIGGVNANHPIATGPSSLFFATSNGTRTNLYELSYASSAEPQLVLTMPDRDNYPKANALMYDNDTGCLYMGQSGTPPKISKICSGAPLTVFQGGFGFGNVILCNSGGTNPNGGEGNVLLNGSAPAVSPFWQETAVGKVLLSGSAQLSFSYAAAGGLILFNSAKVNTAPYLFDLYYSHNDSDIGSSLSVTDPSISIGYQASATVWDGGVTHDLFDVITYSEMLAGQADYRCVFVRNQDSVNTIYDIAIWIASETPGGASVALGIDTTGPSIFNSSLQQALSIASETTAPAGVSFSSPTSKATGIALGHLAPLQVRAFWIRRTALGTGGLTGDSAVICVSSNRIERKFEITPVLGNELRLNQGVSPTNARKVNPFSPTTSTCTPCVPPVLTLEVSDTCTFSLNLIYNDDEKEWKGSISPACGASTAEFCLECDGDDWKLTTVLYAVVGGIPCKETEITTMTENSDIIIDLTGSDTFSCGIVGNLDFDILADSVCTECCPDITIPLVLTATLTFTNFSGPSVIVLPLYYDFFESSHSWTGEELLIDFSFDTLSAVSVVCDDSVSPGNFEWELSGTIIGETSCSWFQRPPEDESCDPFSITLVDSSVSGPTCESSFGVTMVVTF
jgi:hypothetical protein